MGIEDSIAAHCLDDCVMHFGMLVENTLSERVEVGSDKDKRWEAKYELEDLLDPLFRVPREAPKPKKAKPQSGFAAFMALAGASGNSVRRYQYVKPS